MTADDCGAALTRNAHERVRRLEHVSDRQVFRLEPPLPRGRRSVLRQLLGRLVEVPYGGSSTIWAVRATVALPG